MKIKLVQVGKTKEAYLKNGISEYVKRLKPYVDFEVITLREASGNKEIPQQIEEESNLIIEKLSQFDDHSIVILDVKGKKFSSNQFASKLEEIRDQGVGKVVFIIGGAYGMSDELLNKADVRFSMSDMTFTHQMVRLLLMEQIYRAFTIIEGKTYHH